MTIADDAAVLERLVSEALQVRELAYAPYSHFSVGAALLTTDGGIFCGCNIENISYGLTMCAERVAIGVALQAGNSNFSAIAIVSDSHEPVMPCGACRQVLAEFNPDLTVVTSTLSGQRENVPLSVLLPRSRQGILG